MAGLSTDNPVLRPASLFTLPSSSVYLSSPPVAVHRPQTFRVLLWSSAKLYEPLTLASKINGCLL